LSTYGRERKPQDVIGLSTRSSGYTGGPGL